MSDLIFRFPPKSPVTTSFKLPIVGNYEQSAVFWSWSKAFLQGSSYGTCTNV
jgi:hypothetical protein